MWTFLRSIEFKLGQDGKLAIFFMLWRNFFKNSKQLGGDNFKT